MRKRGIVLVTFCFALILSAPRVPCARADGPADAQAFALTDQAVWDGDAPAQAILDRAAALIHLPQAAQTYPTITGRGYAIAVIDSGVDYTHPALVGRYVGGYDYVNNDSNPDDDYGHGTHVAGIALSADANYRGIAPEASYVAVKVIDSGGHALFTNIEKALRWVASNREQYNIVAVNISIGTSSIYNYQHTTILSDELATLKNAGVFIAAGSGNGWYSHQPNQGVTDPAADVSTVAVGDVWSGDFGPINWLSGGKDYTTAADRVVSHCDRSNTMLDLLAPGALITSAAYDWEANSDWTVKGGTSMAAPAVAGLALLVREAIEENWSPSRWPSGAGWQDTILDILRNTGTVVRDGDDENDNVVNLNYDFRRIDALAALDYTVPEPSSFILLCAGSVFLGMRRTRRVRSRSVGTIPRTSLCHPPCNPSESV